MARTLAIPTLPATLDLGARCIVPHKTEAHSGFTGGSAAAGDRADVGVGRWAEIFNRSLAASKITNNALEVYTASHKRTGF
jgi:hypothetical protein